MNSISMAIAKGKVPEALSRSRMVGDGGAPTPHSTLLISTFELGGRNHSMESLIIWTRSGAN